MPTSVSPPYDWLKELEPELAKLDDTPLMGHPPLFPWDQFTQHLASLFELQDLKITVNDYAWRSADTLYTDLASPLAPVHISMSGFTGQICWVLPEIDVPMLMSTLLEDHSAPPLHHIEKEYQQGFYRFLGIEVVNAFTQVDFDSKLVPHLTMGAELPNIHGLCLDVTASFRHHSFTGRLIISETFRTEWKQRYTTTTLSNPHTEKLASQVPLIVTLEAGRTPMLLREWKKAKIGDFLLVENCSLNESFDGGKLLLNYQSVPIYVAELEKGHIKILQALQYHEVATMTERKSMSDDDDDLETEEHDDLEDDETFEDNETSEDDNETSEEEEEEDFSFHQEEEEETEEEEEEEDDETSNNDEDDETSEEEEEPAEEYDEKTAVPISTKIVPPEGPINTEDLPVPLVIEVGRIQISVQKLLELQAGNILDLNVHPEDGVNLVINGRCVGKGELHRLGKTLGVRILELG